MKPKKISQLCRRVEGSRGLVLARRVFESSTFQTKRDSWRSGNKDFHPSTNGAVATVISVTE